MFGICLVSSSTMIACIKYINNYTINWLINPINCEYNFAKRSPQIIKHWRTTWLHMEFFMRCFLTLTTIHFLNARYRPYYEQAIHFNWPPIIFHQNVITGSSLWWCVQDFSNHLALLNSAPRAYAHLHKLLSATPTSHNRCTKPSSVLKFLVALYFKVSLLQFNELYSTFKYLIYG